MERSSLESKIPQSPAPRICIGPKGGFLKSDGPIGIAITTVVTVYDATVDEYEAEMIQIQNTGTIPLWYRFNDDVSLTGPAFSGVLAGGIANSDGLGSILTIDTIKLRKLTLANPSGLTTCTYCLTIFYHPSKRNPKFTS